MIQSQEQQEDGYEGLRRKSEARRGTCRASFRKGGLGVITFPNFPQSSNGCLIWLLFNRERRWRG